MPTLLLVYSIGSVLLIVISIPLMMGRVKPNPFYGFRVPATLEDPELWYPVNAHFARHQFAVGFIQLIASVGLYFWPGITMDGYALSCLGVFVVIFGYALYKGWQYMQSLKKDGAP